MNILTNRQRIYKKNSIVLTLLVVSLFTIACQSSNVKQQLIGEPYLIYDKSPEMNIDVDKTYRANVETSLGDFTILLYAQQAPITVNNFVFLAREGYYDHNIFHTVIDNYMIQSGDPTGIGTGHAGYRIRDELDTGFTFAEGIVAMATEQTVPNSGSSQFFIGAGPEIENLNSDPRYTIFGQVVSGYQTVKNIAKADVKEYRPIEDIVIHHIKIEESES